MSAPLPDSASLLEERTGLRDTITSLGLPILAADGAMLLRGPFLRIPEVPGETVVELTTDNMDRWASKGWLDLRAANWVKWQQRFRRMRDSRPGKAQPGSAGYAPETSSTDEIEIGAVAAWVVSDEIGGRRIK